MQVAPSGYWRHAAQQRNPALRCAHVQRDDVLSVDIERVWQANRKRFLGGVVAERYTGVQEPVTYAFEGDTTECGATSIASL